MDNKPQQENAPDTVHADPFAESAPNDQQSVTEGSNQQQEATSAAVEDNAPHQEPKPAETPEQKPVTDTSKLPAAAAQTTLQTTGAPIGVIVAAVLIAGLLAAVTVYVFLNTDKTATERTTPAQTSQTTAVDESEYDQLTSAIDDASAEETSVTNEELSDSSLGL